MSDRYTEITSQSWFSRIGGALKGILVGFVLIIAGICLLFWNEGRAVKTHKALAESQGLVVSVHPSEILPSMNGKLVHISGKATTEETLVDDVFQVSANALKLEREVETYQWKETSRSEERKKLGGEVETVTTYDYDKVWASGLIDSSEFKRQAGHENPASLMYEHQTWSAGQVSIGQCVLSAEHKARINNFQKLSIASVNLPQGVKRQADQLYYGSNPQKPRIGDQRISFQVISPQDYSAIGSLLDFTLMAHRASNGLSIALVTAGIHTADAMFEEAKSDNRNLTWVLRAVGTIILVLAFAMILKPLSVLADVVPFVGNIVEMGTGFVALILGCVVALIAISIAWFFYRPLLSVAFMVVVASLVYLLKRKSKKASQSLADASTENNAASTSVT